MTCMALYVKPESGINFGRIAERCLRDIEWSQKIAALTVRDDYEPTSGHWTCMRWRRGRRASGGNF